MAHAHGQKIYLQLLLDRNRYELMEDLAREAGYLKTRKGEEIVNISGWAREALYNHLSGLVDESLYKMAKAKDAATWQESVRKRVEGRTKAKFQPGDE